MNFKIKDQKIKIKKNEMNKLLNPKGIFINHCYVMIDKKWHTCVIKIKRDKNLRNIQIINPSLVDEETYQVIEIYCKGIYFEYEISIIKSLIIEYLIGLETINYEIYQFKKRIKKHTSNVILILITLIYTSSNYFFDNVINDMLSKNILYQSISFFTLLYFFKGKKENISNKFNNEDYLKIKEKEKLDLEAEREATI